MHFGTILQMSVTGGIMIAAVLAARPLMRRLGTHGVQVFIWCVALVMLLVPLRPASPASIYNAAMDLPVVTQIFTGKEESNVQQTFDSMERKRMNDTEAMLIISTPITEQQPNYMGVSEEKLFFSDMVSFASGKRLHALLFNSVITVSRPFFTDAQIFAASDGAFVAAGADNMQSAVRRVVMGVWLGGACVMGCGVLVLSVRLRRKFKDAVPREDLCGDMRVYSSAHTASPITYGIWRPRVMLPVAWPAGAALVHVLRHEARHIRNHDALLNMLWLCALCVHWFNPLVWVGWVWLRRDMETRCDAQVVKEMGAMHRTDYAQALLDMARVRRERLLPLAFGAPPVGSRIRRVLAYRAATKRARVAAAGVALLVLLVFATNPARAVLAEQPAVLPAAVQAEGDYVLFRVDYDDAAGAKDCKKRYVPVGRFHTFDEMQGYLGDNDTGESLSAKFAASGVRVTGMGFALVENVNFSFKGLLLGQATERGNVYYMLMAKTVYIGEDGLTFERAVEALSNAVFATDEGLVDPDLRVFGDEMQILWVE